MAGALASNIWLLPALAVTSASPQMMMLLGLLGGVSWSISGCCAPTPSPMPAAPAPPTASMVPPRMVMLLPVLSAPPPMPAPPSPPSAVREPSLPLSSLMVNVPFDSCLFFSRPALLLPLFSLLSPSSSMVASPPPCTVTAALLSRVEPSPLPSPSFLPLPSTSALPLTSIFRSSKVTSTSPLEVSMVTVCSFDLPVMTVSVSSTFSFSPCETLFFPSASSALTVMSPSAMFHRAA